MISKTGEKQFRVGLEVSRSTFSDYESFIHSLVGKAQLKIEGFDEGQSTYVFSNQWRSTLNRVSNVVLSSPLLNAQSVKEVTRLVSVLESMNIRMGESCMAHIRFERLFGLSWLMKLIKRIPPEVWCGFWLVCFLVLKTVELQLQVVLSWQAIYLLQGWEYLSAALFAVALCKAGSKNRQVSHSPGQAANGQNPQKDTESIDVSSQLALSTKPSPEEKLREVVTEFKHPIDHIMAYARFYQNATDSESQHGKDLVELMEQAIRIQEVFGKLNSGLPSETSPPETANHPESNHFRRTPRVLELIPNIVKGVDLLGAEFETPSYTLNTSCRGACILLPEKLVNLGQKIYLQNHRFASEAEVRWVVKGREGTMVFAGVQFSKPVYPAEVSSDHDLADQLKFSLS